MPAGVLFDAAVPEGFEYRSDFVSAGEESALLAGIREIEFSTFEMRGVVARRRVAFFGQTYDRSLRAEPILPPLLSPLLARAADWAGIPVSSFSMALINEYPPGAPIGWHRDAPQYGMVFGLSLLSACRMRFRPYRRPSTNTPGAGERRSATHEITLDPRSAYLMNGESRNAYEHHIPAVESLRYSITFRTSRERTE